MNQKRLETIMKKYGSLDNYYKETGKNIRKAMIKKYGSVKAYKAEMKRRSDLATHSGKGGFKHMAKTNPERLRKISKKGGKARSLENFELKYEELK